MRRQQDQIESVIDLINAIFYRDARHRPSVRKKGSNLLIMRARYSGREYFASQICNLASSKRSANPIWNRQSECPEARPTASRTRIRFITSTLSIDLKLLPHSIHGGVWFG